MSCSSAPASIARKSAGARFSAPTQTSSGILRCTWQYAAVSRTAAANAFQRKLDDRNAPVEGVKMRVGPSSRVNLVAGGIVLPSIRFAPALVNTLKISAADKA